MDEDREKVSKKNKCNGHSGTHQKGMNNSSMQEGKKTVKKTGKNREQEDTGKYFQKRRNSEVEDDLVSTAKL